MTNLAGAVVVVVVLQLTLTKAGVGGAPSYAISVVAGAVALFALRRRHHE